MKISESKEQVLRGEFSLLKKRMRKQNKDNLIFAKTKCGTLLRCLQQRWDYDVNDLCEESRGTKYYTGNISDILHELRND